MKSVRISPIVMQTGHTACRPVLSAAKLPGGGAHRTLLTVEILSFSSKASAAQAIAPAPACIEVNELDVDRQAGPSLLIQIRWSLRL